MCVENEKGACAFEIGKKLKDNFDKDEPDVFAVPKCIQDAIKWACGFDIEETA